MVLALLFFFSPIFVLFFCLCHYLCYKKCFEATKENAICCRVQRCATVCTFFWMFQCSITTVVNSHLDVTCGVTESPVDEEVKPLLLAEQAKFNDVFHHTSQDMRQWLLKGGSYKSGPLAEELRAFFKHIPHDTSVSCIICWRAWSEQSTFRKTCCEQTLTIRLLMWGEGRTSCEILLGVWMNSSRLFAQLFAICLLIGVCWVKRGLIAASNLEQSMMCHLVVSLRWIVFLL